MNFFSHGYRFVDQPYLLAGTAVPDWLSFLDRRVRARRKLAVNFVDDVDPQIAAVARGIVQHHDDDKRFHQCRAFVELSMQLSIRIRDLLPSDDGLRPSFLGHILVEMLLDCHLSKQYPGRLEAYYQALSTVNGQVVESAVNRIAKHKTDRLAVLIPRFVSSRFLFDYAEDALLLKRLNQVMVRVGLSEIPDDFTDLLTQARVDVAAAAADMLDAVESADVG